MENNKTVLNAISLTLGIISIITAFFWYITLPTGIMAIIFGAKGVKKNGSKVGKAGVITGIVGLSLFAFLYLSMIAVLIVENIL